MGSLRLIIGIYGTIFAIGAYVAPKLAKLVVDRQRERWNALEESFKCKECGAQFCIHKFGTHEESSPVLEYRQCYGRELEWSRIVENEQWRRHMEKKGGN